MLQLVDHMLSYYALKIKNKVDDVELLNWLILVPTGVIAFIISTSYSLHYDMTNRNATDSTTVLRVCYLVDEVIAIYRVDFGLFLVSFGTILVFTFLSTNAYYQKSGNGIAILKVFGKFYYLLLWDFS